MDAIGIPLLRGRWFTDADDRNAPNVVVINQALADLYWPGRDPIGNRVFVGGESVENDADWNTIMGVIGNTRHFGLDRLPRPEIYRSYLQSVVPYFTLAVKSDVDESTLTASVRRAVMDVDPGQPLAGVATMEQVLVGSLGSQRFSMSLLLVFAATALVLTGVGLYGVLAFWVSQRSNEIGIRLALGANATGVVGGVMKQGVLLTGLGLIVGTIGALGLTRLMGSMIHGVSATDPTTFACGGVLLSAIGMLACGLPAYRAARVDPLAVLKAE